MRKPGSTATLGTRFSLEELVGSGGFGDVHRGWDSQVQAPVAVKLLQRTSDDRVMRFIRESAVLAELAHPAIVRYVDHGVAPSGQPYLVTEWLEGETLEQRLQRGPLSVVDAWTLARVVSEALTIAHRRGIVHRDVKPSNIFLVDGSCARAKLLDFGVARCTWDRNELTKSGAVIGTPAYMSPEQARTDRELDARADIFSLGATLYECLTGKQPFVGESLLALMAEICLQDPLRPSRLRAQIPPAIEQLVLRMLSKDPAQRPSDGLELSRLLNDVGELSVDDTANVPVTSITADEQRVLTVVLVEGLHLSDTTMSIERPVWATDVDQIQSMLESYGGRLQPLSHGALLGSFLEAKAPTDVAARAARFALALRSVAPDARIAVCTGRAIVRGRSTVGEVTDRAVALLDGPDAGVRVDAATADLLTLRFQLEHRARGAVLIAEREIAETPRTLLGRQSPCVGRRRELNQLAESFAECVEDSSARAVLVTAPPGVGKSRLRYELLTQMADQGHRFETFFGRGDPIRSGAPFALLAAAIRAAAGIAPTDPARAQRQKLRSRIERAMTSAATPAVWEFIGEIAGVHFSVAKSPGLQAARQDPRLMGDRMKAAWLDWLRLELSAHPVIIVLEDLHYGDLPSIQLLDAALHAFEEQPLFVLALARPEVSDRFPALWEARRLELLRLLPLTRKASAELVRAMLDEQATVNLAERVAERAEGNAFFLEELIRAVAEGRTEALPESVVAMVQARLDALGLEAGRILRTASIFGERFSAEAVGALLGEPCERVQEHLNALARREVLVERGPEHAFSHALVRDGCYESLTPEDRTLGHRLAAEWLETSAGADPSALAEHFDRGGQPLRAAAWYARAADLARQGNDLETAMARVQRGVACGATGELLAELKVIQAGLHIWRSELALAEEAATDAALHSREGTATWYTAIRDLVESAGEQSKIRVMEQWTERTLSAQPEAGAASARIACLSWMGGAFSDLDRGDFAGTLLQTCEEDIDRLGGVEAWVASRFHFARGMHRFLAGMPAEALVDLEAAIDAAEQSGDRQMAINAQQERLCYVALLGSSTREDERFLEQSLPELEQASLGFLEIGALFSLALVRRQLGEADAARESALVALDLSKQHGGARMAGVARLTLARIEYDIGNYTAAELEARRAVELLEPHLPMHAAALSVLAKTLLALERPVDALDSASEALAILERLGHVMGFEGLIRLTAAEALWQNGKQDAARQALRSARDHLLRRAVSITDDKLRLNFLQNVDDHARTLDLTRQWGVD